METVYLALGSNVGDSRQFTAAAIKLLGEHVTDIEQAALYQSKAVGYTDQPDFMNTAVRGKTHLTPMELLQFVKTVEQKTGRVKRFRWGPREIDIDIIFYGNGIVNEKGLTIPHPRFAERDFVLRPICDLTPELVDPLSKKTVKQLLDSMPTTQHAILDEAMQDNAKTIQSYDDHLVDYDKGTPSRVDGPFKKWIDKLLKMLPAKPDILEVGSGMGRDAAYIESLGYEITVSDAPTAFVEHLRTRFKHVRQINLLSDEIGGPYNLILAHAVFLHFTAGEFNNLLNQLKTSLKPDGLLAFSMKRGTGAKWSNEKIGAPRFFQYWQPDDLKKLVLNSGYEIVSVEDIESLSGYKKWIHVIARKA